MAHVLMVAVAPLALAGCVPPPSPNRPPALTRAPSPAPARAMQATEFKAAFLAAQASNKAIVAGGAAADAPAPAPAAAAAAAAEPTVEDLDAAIARRNKAEGARRSSVVAAAALEDPDYDSDEEHVDEGVCHRKLKAYGDGAHLDQ